MYTLENYLFYGSRSIPWWNDCKNLAKPKTGKKLCGFGTGDMAKCQPRVNPLPNDYQCICVLTPYYPTRSALDMHQCYMIWGFGNGVY